MALSDYTGQIGFNPSPQPGQGAYGKVPGPTGLPPSLYQQALAQVPGLGQNAATASNATQSLLTGQVSPDTESYIDRLIAAKGVSSGVPGSPFNTADLVKSLGLTSEQLVTSGLQAFDNLLNTVGGLQLNPALEAEISQSNAQLGAAPDPQAAANRELQTLTDFYNRFSAGPSGGTGGFGQTNLLGPRPQLPTYSGPQYTGGFNTPIGSPDQTPNTGLGPSAGQPLGPIGLGFSSPADEASYYSDVSQFFPEWSTDPSTEQ